MPTVFNQGYLVYLPYSRYQFFEVGYIHACRPSQTEGMLYEVSYPVLSRVEAFPPRLYLFGIHSRKLVCMRSKEKEEEQRLLRGFFLKKENFS